MLRGVVLAKQLQMASTTAPWIPSLGSSLEYTQQGGYVLLVCVRADAEPDQPKEAHRDGNHDQVEALIKGLVRDVASEKLHVRRRHMVARNQVVSIAEERRRHSHLQPLNSGSGDWGF